MRRGVTRRQFCLGAGALLLPACSLQAVPTDVPADLSIIPDLTLPPDFSTCGTYNTGNLPGDIALGTGIVYFDVQAAICRDALGLYALTAVCTHEGCTVEFVPANDTFFCPCHRSRFDLDGNVLAGPALLPLVHLGLCLNGDGTLAIDTGTEVGKDVRLVA